MILPSVLRAQIQQLLKDNGFYQGNIDSDFGPLTHDAIQRLDIAEDAPALPADPSIHRVKASSFADPADVASFKRCKLRGSSDQECFKVGDNGVGAWGDDTTGSTPMCALPREDWSSFGAAARGKLVIVNAHGLEVVCELRDTMPRRANIRNGAGIDLNPAACEALGLEPPILVTATWRWA